MYVNCPGSGQDMGNFCRSQERAWLTAWGVIMGTREGVFPVREWSRSVLTIIKGVTAHFLILLLLPVNCSYLNPWSLPTVPPNSPLQPTKEREE